MAAALVDVHPTDRLALRAQGAAGTIRSIRLANPQQAQAWLHDRATELAQALKADNSAVHGSAPEQSEEGEGDSASSGLRPALQYADDHAGAPKAKQFGS